MWYQHDHEDIHSDIHNILSHMYNYILLSNVTKRPSIIEGKLVKFDTNFPEYSAPLLAYICIPNIIRSTW